jgi:polyribonucleotide nucleotidyltransferase
LRHTHLTPQGFVLLDAGVAITNQQQYTAAVTMGLVMARRPKRTLSFVMGLL